MRVVQTQTDQHRTTVAAACSTNPA